MSSQPIERLHPVVEFGQRLVARLGSLAEVPVGSMRSEDKCEALRTLAQGRAQLDALALRLLAEAEQSEATVSSGAASAADWLAIETRQVRREARSDLKLAQRLETHDLIATGMATGRVNVAQARAIVASLGCRGPEPSRSAASSAGPRRLTWSPSRPITTPRTSACWGAGCWR